MELVSTGKRERDQGRKTKEAMLAIKRKGGQTQSGAISGHFLQLFDYVEKLNYLFLGSS